MKRFPVSACTWVRNFIEGAWGVPEAMAAVAPIVDEIVILDVESTDGSYELIQEISRTNSRILAARGKFPYIDANSFVDLSNEAVALCRNDHVLYFEPDQVFHEDLLWRLPQHWERGEYNLAFWVIQYERNFQRVKWFPHKFPMGGSKAEMFFIGDGVRTPQHKAEQDYTGPPIPVCFLYPQEITIWQKTYPNLGNPDVRHRAEEDIKPYVHDMVLDISQTGWCLENVPAKKRMHAPFWHESTDLEGLSLEMWLERERQNPDWTCSTSPFDLPALVRYHVGRTKYMIRPELIQALKEDRALEYIQSLKEYYG